MSDERKSHWSRKEEEEEEGSGAADEIAKNGCRSLRVGGERTLEKGL